MPPSLIACRIGSAPPPHFGRKARTDRIGRGKRRDTRSDARRTAPRIRCKRTEPLYGIAVLNELVAKKEVQLDYATAEKNYIKAICKGLFKIMSKMGISTIRSYRGAKIFEAVGLSEELSNAYFGGLKSAIGGIRLDEVARDAITFTTKEKR